MKGTIMEINRTRGRVAVGSEKNSSFSVFEMLANTNFQVGDELSWQDESSFGKYQIKNITQNEYAEVLFQEHGISLSNLSKQMLY